MKAVAVGNAPVILADKQQASQKVKAKREIATVGGWIKSLQHV
jgi:hypothetical protein